MRREQQPLVLAWCARLFTEHPRSVGETYLGHLRFAARFGTSMIVGGLACLLHGILPFCLTTSGSRRVRALHGVLSSHPARRVHSARWSYDAAAGHDTFNWTI